MVQSTPYQVERLDWEGRKAFVTRTHVDYYTDAIDYTKLKVLERFDGCIAGARHAATTAKCTWCGAWPATRRSATTRTRTSATARSTCPTRSCTPPRVWWQLPQAVLDARVRVAAGGAGRLPRRGATRCTSSRRVAVMAEARDLQKAVGNGDGAWFASARRPRTRPAARRATAARSIAGRRRALRADRVPLRQLPRRRRPERTAVARQRELVQRARANWSNAATARPAARPASARCWPPTRTRARRRARSRCACSARCSRRHER